MQKTRILFLVSGLFVGGIDTLLKNYLAKYDREHYDIELAVGICLKDLESIRNELPKDLKVHYLVDEDILTHFKIKKKKTGLNIAEKIIDESVLNTFRRLKSIYKLKKLSQKFDAIIDFDTHFHYILKDIDKPKIAFYHFSIRQEKESWQRRLGEKLAIYNKVVCICNEMREQAISLYPRLKDKFHSIYNALDFADIVDKATQIPSDLPKGRYIVAVQRLVEDKKDARSLINAFSLVAKNPIADEFKLYIIGDGKDIEDLQNLIDSLNLKNRVILLGYRANPYPYIANAEAFVLSSKSEGCSVSIIESMILDKNIIATQCETGPGELLDYGKGGRLVPVSDSKAMVEAIIDCITNESKNDKLREHSREFVLRFDVNIVLKEIYKLVEKTIEDCSAENK